MAQGIKMDDRKKIQGLIKGRVLFNPPMKKFTSMRVGGPVDALFYPRNIHELRRLIRVAREASILTMVLGRGTNLIVRDRGIRGWMISLSDGWKRIRARGEIVEAEAGVPLQRLVRFCTQAGLTGAEPFEGIPGTVGGGLLMNAGAWGAALGDIVRSVTWMTGDGELTERIRSKLRFSYRKLALPRGAIILKACFQLKRGRREEILERVRSYSEMRRRSQPLHAPSAGCIFKNSKEGPAGMWIEAVGLKGYREGQAMVSDRHANYILNLGNAKAEEILRVMEHVERRVYEEKGISLEREVRVVGE